MQDWNSKDGRRGRKRNYLGKKEAPRTGRRTDYYSWENRNLRKTDDLERGSARSSERKRTGEEKQNISSRIKRIGKKKKAT